MAMAPRGWWAGALALTVAPGLLAAGPADARRPRCWDCDIPFAWDDGAAPRPEAPFLPQGFALTVPVEPGRKDGPGPVTLDRYAEVATALGHCWSPLLAPGDAKWHDMTLRVSFRRDGAVNGVPRVVHVSGPADDGAPQRGRRSLLEALRGCTPLALSPSLGRAIAGQIFAIRFVQ